MEGMTTGFAAISANQRPACDGPYSLFHVVRKESKFEFSSITVFRVFFGEIFWLTQLRNKFSELLPRIIGRKQF